MKVKSQEKQLMYKVIIDSSNRINKANHYKDVPNFIKAIYLPNKKYDIPDQLPVKYYTCKTEQECNSAKYFELTGFIDNSNEFWTHPPRDNDYLKQLEFLPFPNIKFNKKKWSWKLEVGDQWADVRWLEWKGAITLRFLYRLTNTNYPIMIGGKSIICKEISARMISSIAKSEAKFYFNNSTLVKAVYSLLNGDNLEITLE